MNPDLLKYENVSISYNEKQILSDFNLTVKEGERILLKGKSGTGKSTLLKMLIGFTHPTSGKVYFNGTPIDEKTVWDVRQNIAYVSQDLDLFEGPVQDLIDEVFTYASNMNRLDSTKLRRLLVHLELGKPALEKYFEELSGGEKQRIGIITSLMIKKDVYLLDEITAALDLELKEKVAKYFLDHKEWTLIIISHDDVWNKDGVRVVNVGE